MFYWLRSGAREAPLFDCLPANLLSNGSELDRRTGACLASSERASSGGLHFTHASVPPGARNADTDISAKLPRYVLSDQCGPITRGIHACTNKLLLSRRRTTATTVGHVQHRR